ncbi:MAG: hypothetical protein ACOYBC_03030 [Bilifractor sp.]|jgi:hypothetical protein
MKKNRCRNRIALVLALALTAACLTPASSVRAETSDTAVPAQISQEADSVQTVSGETEESADTNAVSSESSAEEGNSSVSASSAEETEEITTAADSSDSDVSSGSQDTEEDSGEDEEEIAAAATASSSVAMYRMYNPNSGEHFYTSKKEERRNLLVEGWTCEGIGWYSPAKSSIPVYRLYNPNAGDHHYTRFTSEVNYLKKQGWRYEGIGWYSASSKSIPVYREYNPNAKTGTHNYTTELSEHNNLVSLGWRAEGIGWYAQKKGDKTGELTVKSVYKMVNKSTGQCAYTEDANMRTTFLYSGWKCTGVAWYAPSVSNVPVYALCNAYTGEYYYTTSASEKTTLTGKGWWIDKGIGWYSDETKSTPIYSGLKSSVSVNAHQYTASATEKKQLASKGWSFSTMCYAFSGPNSSKGVSDSLTRPYLAANPVGKKTLTAFLQNALIPCGRTLYVYGGGWASPDLAVIGYQSRWRKFFDSYKVNYQYTKHRYEYGNGLDCSGYVGWVIYNTKNTTNGKENLVVKSTYFATWLGTKGWTNTEKVTSSTKYYPGDVVSMDGHVWISLGQYSDGSVLLIHSSPNGVQISGTPGTAYTKAKYYMQYCFPDWPYTARRTGYLDDAVKIAHWKVNGSGLLTDPDGLKNKSPDEVMKFLLGQ